MLVVVVLDVVVKTAIVAVSEVVLEEEVATFW